MPGIMDFIAGPAAKIFTTILDEFHMSPEKKAEVQMQMAAMQAAAEQADRDLEAKLNDIAGQNIRTETSSNDWFVRRARPAFLWVMTLGIGFNMILPLVCRVFGKDLQPVDLSAYMSLFTAGFLGYTAARSFEKKNDKA